MTPPCTRAIGRPILTGRGIYHTTALEIKRTSHTSIIPGNITHCAHHSGGYLKSDPPPHSPPPPSSASGVRLGRGLHTTTGARCGDGGQGRCAPPGRAGRHTSYTSCQ
eukprot:2515068-Prymnesium_polylepis.1